MERVLFSRQNTQSILAIRYACRGSGLGSLAEPQRVLHEH